MDDGYDLRDSGACGSDGRGVRAVSAQLVPEIPEPQGAGEHAGAGAAARAGGCFRAVAARCSHRAAVYERGRLPAGGSGRAAGGGCAL